MFVDEMKIWTEQRKALLAEQETTQTISPEPRLLTPDLGRVYREKVEQLTAAFKDDALKAQAFERLRALIEAAVLTPEDGDLAIDLRGELARCCRYVLERKLKSLRGGDRGGVANQFGCGDRI